MERSFRGGGGFRRGGFRSFDGPREMHKITCSECGKEAEVPFKPRKDTPVYCKECFMKKKGITPRTEKKSEESEETAEAESEESEEAEESEEEQ
ncbi:hypothetical protein HYW76_05290 [Candidatus Pacearchaeota archaeon]|nr:hypothetical protein [Candidatus Pacearchaeota archaeon]